MSFDSPSDLIDGPNGLIDLIYDGRKDPDYTNSLTVTTDFCEYRAENRKSGVSIWSLSKLDHEIKKLTGPVTSTINFNKIVVVICGRRVITFDKVMNIMIFNATIDDFCGACVYANNFYKWNGSFVTEYLLTCHRISNPKNAGYNVGCDPMISLRRHYKKHYWTTVNIAEVDLGIDLYKIHGSRGISLAIAAKGFHDVFISCFHD